MRSWLGLTCSDRVQDENVDHGVSSTVDIKGSGISTQYFQCFVDVIHAETYCLRPLRLSCSDMMRIVVSTMSAAVDSADATVTIHCHR